MPLSGPETVLSSAASMAVGFNEDTTFEILRQQLGSKHALEGLIVCISKTGAAASLIAK